MRILIGHNDYGRFSGEEQAIEDIANVLSIKGHEIDWFRYPGPNLNYSIRQKVCGFFSGIYSFRSRKGIGAVLSNKRYDIVLIQNLYPFISPSILSVCKEHNIPIVMRCPNYRLFCPNGLHLSRGEICERCLYGKEWHCILRNCEDNYFKSTGYAIRNAAARISGMITKNVSHYIVLSEFQKQRFADGGIPPEKISVLPNAVLGSRKTGEHVCGRTLSFIGRSSLEKGIHLFLEAARRMPEKEFTVAGRIKNSKILKSVPKNVNFVGFLSGQDLDEFYRNTYALIFPSIWYEGYPNTLVRAMAYGKPVVASRIGAIPEIVGDGVHGYLFEPGNVDDLVKQIKMVLEDPGRAKKMGEAGAKKVAAKNSGPVYYEKLMKIYQQAMMAQ